MYLAGALVQARSNFADVGHSIVDVLFSSDEYLSSSDDPDLSLPCGTTKRTYDVAQHMHDLMNLVANFELGSMSLSLDGITIDKKKLLTLVVKGRLKGGYGQWFEFRARDVPSGADPLGDELGISLAAMAAPVLAGAEGAFDEFIFLDVSYPGLFDALTFVSSDTASDMSGAVKGFMGRLRTYREGKFRLVTFDGCMNHTLGRSMGELGGAGPDGTYKRSTATSRAPAAAAAPAAALEEATTDALRTTRAARELADAINKSPTAQRFAAEKTGKATAFNAGNDTRYDKPVQFWSEIGVHKPHQGLLWGCFHHVVAGWLPGNRTVRDVKDMRPEAVIAAVPVKHREWVKDLYQPMFILRCIILVSVCEAPEDESATKGIKSLLLSVETAERTLGRACTIRRHLLELIDELGDLRDQGLAHSRFAAAKTWCDELRIPNASANALITAMVGDCKVYLEGRPNVQEWLTNPGNMLAALGDGIDCDEIHGKTRLHDASVRPVAKLLYNGWDGAAQLCAERLGVRLREFDITNNAPDNIFATRAFSNTELGAACKEEVRILATDGSAPLSEADHPNM
jgi:hypothetical protein